MKDASDLSSPSWPCIGLAPVSASLSCTGEPRAGPSTADVASTVLSRAGKEVAGAREAVFDLGMAKDVFRTLHSQRESYAAASDLEEWVSAGSSLGSALASAWCPQ